MAKAGKRTGPASLEFFSKLVWLDGRNLLDTIEPYRRDLFTKAFDTYRDDGTPAYNLMVAGRSKKNNKTTDLVLGATYCTTIRRSVFGNDALILASDEDQAGDDLSLARKLVACNPSLAAEIETLAKELRFRDGSGSIRVLPAKDVAGLHGKSASFVGLDEVHTYRDWSLLEALQPDPTRPASMVWITSYASMFATAGAPLHDLMQIGKAGTDMRMLFSWYSGDYCTDPNFADLPPEQRANPSMASWPDGMGYIEQQRTRLPFGRFRRLHLNLPGSPENAALDQGAVLRAVVTGRRSLPYQEGVRYVAACDMSGGSIDDACLCIAHAEGRIVVIDLVAKQIGRPPFNTRDAVRHFCEILKAYNISTVTGDAQGGLTHRYDFQDHGVRYVVRTTSASDLYERLEPVLNAAEIELPDHPTLIEQAVSLVWRGGKINHEHGGHDDHVTVVALAVHLVRDRATDAVLCGPVVFSNGASAFAQVGGASAKTANPAAAWSAANGYSGGGGAAAERFDNPDRSF